MPPVLPLLGARRLLCAGLSVASLMNEPRTLAPEPRRRRDKPGGSGLHRETEEPKGLWGHRQEPYWRYASSAATLSKYATH